MKEWHLYRDENSYGPYTQEQLQQMFSKGEILPGDLVWSAGLKGWTPVEQVPELMDKKAPSASRAGEKPPPALNYQILGTVMPMVEIKLKKDERLYAQSGAMQWMDQNIKMDTEMKGGVFGALKRSVSGEAMFVQYFTGMQEGAVVAFGHTYPGNIIPLDISKGTIICQRRAFLCAFETVNYDVYFQRRIGAGFFGGEGFIMQKLSGHGTAFIEIDGECIEKQLGPGEKIRVETGSVGAIEEGVDFNIERVKGIKNMFLGGEGMFLTTLTGPGKVWIQTMPIQSMSGELFQYLPKSSK